MAIRMADKPGWSPEPGSNHPPNRMERQVRSCGTTVMTGTCLVTVRCSRAGDSRHGWSRGRVQASRGVRRWTEMEMDFFARFHARPGCAEALAGAIHEVIDPTRAEPGCVS